VPPARPAPPALTSLRSLRPEKVLTGAVLALVCFGVVMVYSSSSATALLGDGDPLGLMTRQALYALLGLGAYALCVRMDMRALRRLAPLALAVSGFLLVVVLVPGVGIEVNGSRRWLGVGSMAQLQPSELVKVALVLWLAAAVARNPGRLRRPSGLVPFLAVAGVLALLVLIEPDMGTAALLVAVTASTLIVAGARPAHLAGVGAVVALVGVAAIAAAPYRRARLLAFLDPWGDPTNAGFQAVQAQVAFGSGGLGGVGLGDGLQKAFYLPEAHTDMILATVGEELGLVGVMAVLVAFGALAVAGYRIALGAGDLHQQLVAAGLTTLMVAQAAINMGAVLGLMPVTGVPLPFVSYGGSSLVVLLAGVGILVNIAHRSQRAERSARRGPVGLVDPGADRGGGDGRARNAGARRRRSAAGARG
jgi:cell division protein FtsW